MEQICTKPSFTTGDPAQTDCADRYAVAHAACLVAGRDPDCVLLPESSAREDRRHLFVVSASHEKADLLGGEALDRALRQAQVPVGIDMRKGPRKGLLYILAKGDDEVPSALARFVSDEARALWRNERMQASREEEAVRSACSVVGQAGNGRDGWRAVAEVAASLLPDRAEPSVRRGQHR